MAESRKIKNYRDLAVWQKGMDIALAVYKVTKHFPDDERFGLISQLRRAAVSVPANIAEGHPRSTTKDYLRFVSIAIGSLAETATFIELAGRLSYGDVNDLRKIFEMTTEERRMLRALQTSLRRRLPPT
ncbi:MAG TPA: four helix bundle protein [Lacipirellulaceae bacterium]|nr:four helix bundle protein [Lacipirellulaceae bacterium]